MLQNNLCHDRWYNIDRTVGITRLLTGIIYSVLSFFWTGGASIFLLLLVGYSSLWCLLHQNNQAKPTVISYVFLIFDLILLAGLGFASPHNFITRFGMLYILGLIFYLFRFGQPLALIWLVGSILQIVSVGLYLMSMDCLYHMSLIPVLIISYLFIGKVLADEERVKQQLQNLSETDQLTGLANFRGLQARLEWCASHEAGKGDSLSLIILDIDNFKKYNDTYGHEQGNRLLKELAEYLMFFMGSGDFMARYGGEEFIVLLPGVNQDTAKQTADRLVSGIAAHSFNHGPVTISAGIASTTSGSREEVFQLIEKADQALYRAKRNGKNQAVLYTEETEE